MKSILATMALILSTQAHARFITADELFTVVKCTRAHQVPDLGLTVELKEGGIAGLTQLVVNQSFLSHSSSNTYIVRPEAMDPKKLGAPVIYNGNGVTLSVNYTTPDENGGTYGLLETLEANGDVTSIELSCQSLAHIM